MPTLWTSDQLVAHDFPEPSFLVDPVIPQGGTFILYGKPGAGKSQLVLTLAHAINNGLPFLGRWPTRQGSVVVVQVDMTSQIQQSRLARITDSVDLSSTFWTVEEDGSIPIINIESMSITNHKLVDQIREIDPVLVVWDTLRKIHHLPENASETPIKIFNKAHQIAPKATHGFLHHSKKESRDPDAVDTRDEDFMGSQQWKGAADATVSLTEIDTPPKRLILQWHKARTAPDTERQPIILEMDMGTILLQSTE